MTTETRLIAAAMNLMNKVRAKDYDLLDSFAQAATYLESTILDHIDYMSVRLGGTQHYSIPENHPEATR